MNQIQFQEISLHCNQNVGKSLQTSRAKPLGWSNNSLISRNFCKPLNFSMKSDLLLVKKNMLHSIFFILFCYGGKFIIQKMNEGAFVIVTHGFNNSSYKWRRSIGKKEEIIFYDLIILHSIAFTTEKVFMNHSEQYWKPKETKKSSQLFFCRLNLRFLTRKVWDKNVCFYDDVFVIQNTTLKFLFELK